jgi:hypothetical protein
MQIRWREVTSATNPADWATPVISDNEVATVRGVEATSRVL